MKKTYNEIVKLLKANAKTDDFREQRYFKFEVYERYFVVFDSETGGLVANFDGINKIYYLNRDTPYCLDPELEKLKDNIQAKINQKKCNKGLPTGQCCCNCGNHYEDFYHCITEPKPDSYDKNNPKCVCNVHKGWICLVSFEGEEPKAHSDWSEHGFCEMWRPKK